MTDDSSPSTVRPTPAAPAARRSPWLWAGVVGAIASLVTACKSPPTPPGSPEAPGTPAGASAGAPRTSAATTARAYRQDAATHLYALNQHRIYQGRLPPMLYAVGVLEVDLDRAGRVQRLNWLRAPRHAPEVVAEIERTVRAAAPYPAPARVSGKTSYTDTWLWDKSGRFQLDTLTEGQN